MRHDTRLSFNELARVAGLTPRQKIAMRRYILKGGEQIK